MKAPAHGSDSLGIEPEPVHPPDVAGVLDLDAAIHHHGHAARLGNTCPLLVNHVVLTPHGAGVDLDRVRCNIRERVGGSEHIDDVDGNAQIEQARTEGKVDASIFAGYMRQSMGFGVRGINDAGTLAPVQGVFHYVGVGVKLSLPVRNKNQGNIEAAQAQLEAARNRREFAQHVVVNEVAAAYVRFMRAREALSVYRDAVHNQAERNLDVIRQTYELGQRSLIDYVSEQRRFIDVETGYTDVLKEYLDSMVDIERAVASPVPSA